MIAVVVPIGVMIALLVAVVYNVRLEKIDDRREFQESYLTEEMKSMVRAKINGVADSESIIRIAEEIACKYLRFVYRNDLANGRANCVGYAQLTSELINYAFQIKSLPYKAKPVYGKAYIWGLDLHPIFQCMVPKKYKSFFKDHDFVEVLVGDSVIYVDASFKDLFGMEYLKKK